jgi:hypothetical protein
MHEVAAGDLYHPQIESVPEQTWSSAGFYSATVHGLLGLQVDASRRHLTFAPHLPLDWEYVTVDKVRVGKSVLKLQVRRSQDGIELAVENSGPAVSIEFKPEVPLGAMDLNASLETGQRNASRLDASVVREAQDEQVVTAFIAEKGNTHCRVRFRGGVELSVPRPELRVGDSSTGLKVAGVSLKGKTLTVTGYLKDAGEALFTVRSGWKLIDATGAEVESHQGDLYTMTLQMPGGAMSSAKGGYVKVSAELQFADR